MHINIVRTQQTWSGFSPTTVPDNKRQSRLSPTTVPEMSIGKLTSESVSMHHIWKHHTNDMLFITHVGQDRLFYFNAQTISAGCVRVPASQMGHNYPYAHVSPKKLQHFNNKPARDLVLDLVLILTKDYCYLGSCISIQSQSGVILDKLIQIEVLYFHLVMVNALPTCYCISVLCGLMGVE